MDKGKLFTKNYWAAWKAIWQKLYELYQHLKPQTTHHVVQLGKWDQGERLLHEKLERNIETMANVENP